MPFLPHNIFQTTHVAMFPRKPETHNTKIIRDYESMITLATVELFLGQTTQFHVCFLD